jgi:hypothetical protein
VSHTDLFHFRLTVAKARTDRDLVFLLLHAETIAADRRQTQVERERSQFAVWCVRDRMRQFREQNRAMCFPIPVELREAA